MDDQKTPGLVSTSFAVMKNLCMITHKLKKGDGQGRVNYEILLAAHSAGYSITLLASECAPEVASLEGVTWILVPVSGWPTQLLRNQLFAMRSWWWLKRTSLVFDLVHANGFITWYPAAVNSAHFVHGAWQDSPYNETRTEKGLKKVYHQIFTWINAVLERRSYRQARWVIAVSPKIAEELIGIGVDPEKIIIIPNGIDVQEYCPGTAGRELPEFEKMDNVALFAGDLRSSRKNLETVLRALTVARSWHLIVLGYLEHSVYPDMVRDMGLADRVHFMGYREDVAAFLHSSDLLVFPSHYDPWAMIVSESLACAVPVITARTVGASFQVPDNGGWILDDPDDYQSIADFMEDFSKLSLPKRKEMATAARDSAINFSWDVVSKNYVDLYDCMSSHAFEDCRSFFKNNYFVRFIK
jgi:Glycosyltransferase